MEKNDSEEELSYEEIVENNDIVLNSLIDLLISKKIITEKELEEMIDKSTEEADEE
jgi:hypothetical protein